MSALNVAQAAPRVNRFEAHNGPRNDFRAGEWAPAPPPHIWLSARDSGVLEALYAGIPFRTFACAHDRYAEQQKRDRFDAIASDEIALSAEGWRSTITIDLDRSDAATIDWAALRLPAPNIVVVNPANGHAHATWLLTVWVPLSHTAQAIYWADVRRDMCAAIPGADPAYRGVMTHSPWSSRWHTIVIAHDTYSLDELRAAAPRAKRQYGPQREAAGRNDYVFRAGDARARELMRRDHAIDAAFERDVRATMRAAIVEAEIRFPADHRYAEHEFAASLRSVIRRATKQREKVVVHPSSVRLRETIRKRVQRGGTDRDTYLARSRERRATALEMRADGVPVREIAQTLMCSVREVYRLTAPASSANADVVDVATDVHSRPTTQEYDGGSARIEASPSAQIIQFPSRESRPRLRSSDEPHEAYCGCPLCKRPEREPWWDGAPPGSLFGIASGTSLPKKGRAEMRSS